MKKRHRTIGIYLILIACLGCTNQTTVPENDDIVVQPTASSWETFEVLPIDRIFYVENHHLTSLQVEINDHAFSLTVDSTLANRSVCAYYIEPAGNLRLDLEPAMLPENNVLSVLALGPASSSALIFVADLVEGEPIDHILELCE